MRRRWDYKGKGRNDGYASRLPSAKGEVSDLYSPGIS